MNRMSEVFKLPLFVCTNNPQMITAKSKGRYHDCTIRSPDESEVRAAVIAINNHDQLTDENARLRDFVVSLSKCTTQSNEVDNAYGGTDRIDYISDEWKERAIALLNKDTKQ